MSRDGIDRVLGQMGLPTEDLGRLPDSPKRFADGAQYRIEIPSTEGPRGLEAVLDAADALAVTVHRVSQGSGVMMLTDDELDEMAAIARVSQTELSLFARPNGAWDTSAMAMSDEGRIGAPVARGQAQLVQSALDIERAADHGVLSVLIADLGLLSLFGEIRAAGVVPGSMQAKISVQLPVANAATAQVVAGLGAGTLNLPTDLSLAQIAAIRAAIDIPLDLYVEAPGGLGGFIRLHEIPEIIRVAAPVYLKFGLRNDVSIYPYGEHLAGPALAMSRERVHRARLGLELLERSGYSATTSEKGTSDAKVPVLVSRSGGTAS